MMNSDQYERAYREAREALYRRGKKTGRQVYGKDGLRYCVVDGLPLSDWRVFKEAWNEEIAGEIWQSLTNYVSATPQECPECRKLWHQYHLATASYLENFKMQQMAVNSGDSAGFLAACSMVLDQAGEKRRLARQSVRNHWAAHVFMRQVA